MVWRMCSVQAVLHFGSAECKVPKPVETRTGLVDCDTSLTDSVHLWHTAGASFALDD
jgi:hypothetical protein